MSWKVTSNLVSADGLVGVPWAQIPANLKWTPASITTSLWLDAADVATVTTVSGNVSQWNDKSGNGRNATQATAASRPVLTSSSLNGYNGVTFDGSNDYLAFSSAVLSVSHSLFILFSATVESAPGSVFGQWAAGQTGRYLWNANQDSFGNTIPGALNVFNTSASSGNGSGGGAAAVLIGSNPVIVGSISETGSEAWKLFSNGSEWDSATVTSLYTGVNSALGSANATSSINPFDGQIYEVVTVESAVSLSTRQKIEGYFAHKWGLTANLPNNHPYKTTVPLP